MTTISLQSIISAQLKARKKKKEDLAVYLGMTRVNLQKQLNHNRLAYEYLEKTAEFLQVPLPELLVPLYYTESEAKVIGSILQHVREKTKELRGLQG
jgi:transcriptional regulator with XRE-family HTH domain